MRILIALCLVVAACADKLGYNYRPVGHSDAGLSFAPGVGGPGGSVGGVSGPVGNEGPAGPAETDKEFYSFSAPDADFDDGNAAQQIANAVRRNLRVVFIKGPEHSGLEDAALALARQAAEDRLAIYVLNKQADIGDLANRLNAARSANSNRPEVHFVKYRTPQDAENAQRTIQSQYDALGGSSQSHNGGVAPVINFASQAPVRAPAAQAPGNAYLPSSIIRRFRL